MFKSWIRGLLALGKLIVGLLNYLVFKRTPAFAHQAMISHFCLSKGYSNDVLSKIINCFNSLYHLIREISFRINDTTKTMFRFFANVYKDNVSFIVQKAWVQ